MRLSLFVIAGSALGGLARYWLALWVATAWGPDFPWGTLLINTLGSLVIGAAATALPASADAARAFLMVGICGGFTTFSAYSLQSLQLLQTGRTAAAMAYMAGSAVLCLAATAIGWSLGKLA